MLVTLITPTGSRPEAFKRCEEYMARQTYRGPIQWIIVDDGDIPTQITPGPQKEYYRATELWREGINTQRPNMNLAMSKVKGDFIFVIEDDDWYHPEYLQTYVSLLEQFPLVGEGKADYYNVASQGYKQIDNYYHASLCQTGMRKELLPKLYNAVNSGQLYFDIQFWNTCAGDHTQRALFMDKKLLVGIKGMPGRGGIGVGHRTKDCMYDPEWRILKSWIGETDAKFYEQFSLLNKGDSNAVNK
jgi:glycosyltransferase involved in cell wall biosynthesis